MQTGITARGGLGWLSLSTSSRNTFDLTFSQYPASLKRFRSSVAGIRLTGGLGMDPDRQIRELIRALLSNTISLREFEDQFVPVAWEIESLSPESADLVYAVDLRLAEYTSGHWTIPELLEKLGEVVADYTIAVHGPGFSSRAASAGRQVVVAPRSSAGLPQLAHVTSAAVRYWTMGSPPFQTQGQALPAA